MVTGLPYTLSLHALGPERGLGWPSAGPEKPFNFDQHFNQHIFSVFFLVEILRFFFHVAFIYNHYIRN